MDIKLTQFLLIILIAFNISGQEQLHYSRVKIDLTGINLIDISSLGLDIEHGTIAKGRFLISDFSNYELNLLDNNGYKYEILIDDVQDYYIEQNTLKSENQVKNRTEIEGCETRNNILDFKTPINYSYGSMGGYHTYDEMLEVLDSMVQKYPHLISPVHPIDTILTYDGNPIYWLKVSNKPNEEENEPEVLYTALHHAREPNSLSQMIYFLWYLLENYESDAEIKNIVDNVEIYFIPCVNPDGYIYNQITNPLGGGMWRKNMWRDNTTVYGVDLNRNYGYKWGFDNIGSSTDVNSETYRGSSAFSEPETQAVRNFCNSHTISIALNYHTFGNLLIHPWGYNDQETDKHNIFSSIGKEMIKYNNFALGTGTATVGYVTNGDSDDWMFGDTINKNAIISFTPEVGMAQHGFWPPQSAIETYNKSCMYQNLMAANCAIDNVIYSSSGDNILFNDLDTIYFELKNIGLQDGTISFSVSSFSDNISILSEQQTYTFKSMESKSIPILYKLKESIPSKDQIILISNINKNNFSKIDTVRKIYLGSNIIETFSESGIDIKQWDVNGNWELTSSDFISEPSCITDSPVGNYEDNKTVEIITKNPIDLSNSEYAILKFKAKWRIEKSWDYVQILASDNGTDYYPLCGNHTVIGGTYQDYGNPLYDGFQDEWVDEIIILDDFIGGQMWLKFQLVSDMFVNEDGFYFDDLKVFSSNNISNNDDIQFLGSNEQLTIFPNPALQQIEINFESKVINGAAAVNIYNELGQLVYQNNTKMSEVGKDRLLIDISNLVSGHYIVLLNIENNKSYYGSFDKLK